MAIPNFTLGFYGNTDNVFSLAQGNALLGYGSFPPPEDQPEEEVRCHRERADQAKRASAIFTPLFGATWARELPEQGSSGQQAGVAPHKLGEIAASPTPEGKSAFTELAIVPALPQLPIERIFHFLSLQTKPNFSLSCKAFHELSHGCHRQRCLELLRSDKNNLFGRFGIYFPAEATPSFAQMEPMIARLDTIIGSMKEVLREFREVPMPAYTSEEFLLRRPASELQSLLETACRCALYRIFAPLAKLPTPRTLEEAAARIREWVCTDEGQATEAIGREAPVVSITCIPLELGLLKNLTYLALANNRIAALPLEFWGLKKLKWLDLHNNQLETLSAEISNFRGLEGLDLHDNRLSTLHPEIGQLAQLRTLRLGGNRIATLPGSIEYLANLEILSLGSNQLKEVPVTLGRLARLRYLDLSHNELSTDLGRVGQWIHFRCLAETRGGPSVRPQAPAYWPMLQELELDPAQFACMPALGRRCLRPQQVTQGQGAIKIFLPLLGGPEF